LLRGPILAAPSFLALPSQMVMNNADLFSFTRELVDIPSVTGSERQVADFLAGRMAALASRFSGGFERIPSAPDRDNLFLTFDDPVVTLSTHIDTVPPFFASREDPDTIWGRGSCDAKGIAAAMIAAAESLLGSGIRNLALLFVIGEERDSAGATTMAASPRGSQFLINGEPTENQLALGSKGALRYELIAHGKLAHSAYPEFGHSAIHALLDALHCIRQIPLPQDSLLGCTTLNVGVICGGRAPNVIADEARAEIMFRIVGDPASLRRAVLAASDGRVDAREVLCTPAIQLASFSGLPTTIVAFTTDIPFFQGTWGKPFLIGPGSIHVAHTSEEHIPKTQLVEAVDIYGRMVKQLLLSGEPLP
jgi:acetylornithine deacetylase